LTNQAIWCAHPDPERKVNDTNFFTYSGVNHLTLNKSELVGIESYLSCATMNVAALHNFHSGGLAAPQDSMSSYECYRQRDNKGVPQLPFDFSRAVAKFETKQNLGSSHVRLALFAQMNRFHAKRDETEAEQSKTDHVAELVSKFSFIRSFGLMRSYSISHVSA
jgi:hypothetical protein